MLDDATMSKEAEEREKKPASWTGMGGVIDGTTSCHAWV